MKEDFAFQKTKTQQSYNKQPASVQTQLLAQAAAGSQLISDIEFIAIKDIIGLTYPDVVLKVNQIFKERTVRNLPPLYAREVQGEIIWTTESEDPYLFKGFLYHVEQSQPPMTKVRLEEIIEHLELGGSHTKTLELADRLRKVGVEA